MLCAFLRALGHEAHEAADGVTGVAAALDLAPDLTLVDIGLPGDRRLRGGAPHPRRRRAAGRLRLVALTGYGMPEDRARALESGFDTHLVKPVDPAKLTALLASESPR